ncbi:hypothetical protein [Alteromonas sp. a30]|uniref:hypothetical protein n=1 Tax=Alteromonas sp. a30 TaxID=2730917 RepID=UPI00227F786C|nr:hypothetical protein [Alteromonas sp. a30]MCY7295763.1 hypothetical protein [Alteromonas sp. a30]
MRNLWSVVVHDVGTRYANIWLGTLNVFLRKPEQMLVKLSDENGTLLSTQHIHKSAWQKPFRFMEQRFYTLLRFDDLKPMTRYRVAFFELDDGVEIELRQSEAIFDTLGESLLDYSRGLNVAMGSCFSEQYDGGCVSRAYTGLYQANIEDMSPHFTFLMGDQVYLDVGIDSLSPRTEDIQERIAQDYAIHWNGLQGVLKHGATWFLADDHEFWNNFPFISGIYPYIQALRFESIHNTWLETAREAVDNIQRVENIRFVNIGDDLSFCLADFRTQRTATHLLQEKDFEQVLSWMATLNSPGVLVISQPLIDECNKEDKKLPDYAQYGQLLQAIQQAPHDILVLAGDLHCGRICSFQFQESNKHGEQRVMHEVVASPLSNLCGPTSLAVRTTCHLDRPCSFPPVEVPSVKQAELFYPNDWCVSTEYSLMDVRYFKERTKEHFKTLNFQKVDNGVEVKVRTWLVREIDQMTGLPKQDCSDPVTLLLR